jgi:hypothetical protein
MKCYPCKKALDKIGVAIDIGFHLYGVAQFHAVYHIYSSFS